MGDYSMLLILTFAAATLSLLAFLAVLQLPKAMRNVVQEVHAERMAERRQAVTIECIYRDYRAYKNITSLIAAPMEVGTAKEQTLASIRELVSGVERLVRYTVGLFVFTLLFAISVRNRIEGTGDQLVILVAVAAHQHSVPSRRKWPYCD
jgi:hypothetical protein